MCVRVTHTHTHSLSHTHTHINAQVSEDNKGDTPLHLACRSRSSACVRHVLSAAAIELSAPSGAGVCGAKGDLMTAVGLVSRVSGRTPLHHAAEAGDLASVRMLLDAHAHLVPWIVHTRTHARTYIHTHTHIERE
jgi:hypothetical protein